MYSLNATTGAAWRTLLEWVIARSGVAGEVVEYPPPQSLPALWARPDLGCAFMCGFPLATAELRPTVLAAPVPSSRAYGGIPRYRTCLVARADGPVRSVADMFGRRMAFTTPDSQSGYQSPRHFFAAHAAKRGQPLFAATVGPLVTPRRVVEAVLEDEADAGPVDSYAFDLLREHEPQLVAPLAVIATTPWTPIPPLVGAADLEVGTAALLQATLLSVARSPELAPVRAALLLQGFAPVTANDYRSLAAHAADADRQGYPRLA